MFVSVSVCRSVSLSLLLLLNLCAVSLFQVIAWGDL